MKEYIIESNDTQKQIMVVDDDTDGKRRNEKICTRNEEVIRAR